MPYSDPEKQKLFQRKWKRKQNERYRLRVIDLLGGHCIDCNNNDVRVLQIDHIEPLLRKLIEHKKSMQTGTNLIQAILTNKTDLKSVALRCANCHMIKTFQERIKYSTFKGD